MTNCLIVKDAIVAGVKIDGVEYLFDKAKAIGDIDEKFMKEYDRGDFSRISKDFTTKSRNEFDKVESLGEEIKSTNYNVEIYKGNWTREDVAKQTDKVFLFGDNVDDRINTKHIPTSTQAVIRGLPNAIGIDTKRNRGTSSTSYMTNDDFELFARRVNTAIQQAKSSGKIIVIPEGGIGTGKAELEKRAPKLFNYLKEQLDNLIEKSFGGKVGVETSSSEDSPAQSVFQGYVRADGAGKGTAQGDGKDIAMRKTASGGFIGEIDLVGTKGSSTLTSFFSASGVDIANKNPLLARINDNKSNNYSIYDVNNIPDTNYPVSVARSNGNNKEMFGWSPDTVMLARNKEFKNKELSENTKSEIEKAHKSGATFVVGDMPGVDSQFIDYLQEIGASFKVYHTGEKSRITVENGNSNNNFKLSESQLPTKPTNTQIISSILSDYDVSFDTLPIETQKEILEKMEKNPSIIEDNNFIKALTCL